MHRFLKVFGLFSLVCALALAGVPRAALAAPMVVTTSLPDGTVGQAYSSQLSATGSGTIIFEKWYLTHSGTSMTLASSGVFSGTPTQAGTFELGVRVTDGSGLGVYSIIPWKVNTSGTTSTAPTLTGIQGFDPNATPQYNNSQAASGAFVVLYGTFAATGNQLVSTGTVTGTISFQSATQINVLLGNGTGTATFAVTNQYGTSSSRSIPVAAAGTLANGTLALSESLSGVATVIPASTSNYTFANFGLRAGNTPATITSLRVVSDSASRDQFSNMRLYKDRTAFVGTTATTLNMVEGNTRYATITFSPALTIPANTTVNLEVSASIGAASAGTMRLGLDALQNNGIPVTSTPATPFYGPTFTITGTTSQTLAITTPDQLQDGMVGAAYSISLAASGGTAPYTWSTLSGQYNTYPCCYTQLNSNGTFVSVNSGQIMPFAGTYQVPVKITDATGATAQKVFTFVVKPATTPTTKVAEGYVDSVSATTLSGWAYNSANILTPVIVFSFQNTITGAAVTTSWAPTQVRTDVANYLQTKYGVNAFSTATGFTLNPTALIGQAGTYRLTQATLDSFALTLSETAKQAFTIGGNTPNSPMGKYVRVDGDPTVYWVTLWGAKMPVLNAQIFLSYGGKWEDVVMVNQEILDSYDDVEYIKVANNARVYKIEGSVKRYITPAAATRLNIDPVKVVTVNQAEFVTYRTGTTIK